MKRAVLFISLLTIFHLMSSGQGHVCKEDLFPQTNENRRMGYVNIFGEWRIQPMFTKVFPFSGKAGIVFVRGKYGVVNCDGRLVIPCQYEEIKKFVGGVAWVKSGGKWGLLSEEGEKILETVYDDVNEISAYSDYTFIKKDSLWGLYAQYERKFISEPQFTRIKILNHFHSLVAYKGKLGIVRHDTAGFIVEPEMEKVNMVAPYTMAFLKQGKWGLVRDNGLILSDASYDSIATHYKFRLLVKSKEKYGLIDFKGRKVLPIIFDEVGPFKGGGARVFKDNKYGFIGFKGNKVIPLVYDSAHYFMDGNCIVKKNGRWGLINAKNEWLLQNEWDKVYRNPSNPFYVAEIDHIIRLYDIKGDAFNDQKYLDIKVEDTAKYVRLKASRGWRFWNSVSNKFYSEQYYDQLTPMRDGFAFCYIREQWGVLDAEANEVVKAQYDSIAYQMIGAKMCFKVYKGDRCGLITSLGQTVVPIVYKEIAVNEKNVIKVRDSKGYRFMNYKGSMITQKIYEGMSGLNAKDLHAPVFPTLVKYHDKWGMIDKNANYIMKPTYLNLSYLGEGYYAGETKKGSRIVKNTGQLLFDEDNYFEELGKCSERFIAVKQNGKWGFFDYKAKRVKLKSHYDHVDQFIGGVCVVGVGEKWGLIDKIGREMIKWDHQFYYDGRDRILENDHEIITIKPDGSYEEKQK